MKFKKAYDKHKRHTAVNLEPSMTQQNSRDECDINRIMTKYQKTGIISHLNSREQTYEDFSNLPDYHDALNSIKQAEEAFMTIPAKLRLRFNNDPGKFIEFCTDPKNHEEMVVLGLAERDPQLPLFPDSEDRVSDPSSKSSDPKDGSGEATEP